MQPSTSQRCTQASRSGAPCRAWAVRGSSPPRCASHGGRAPDPAPVAPAAQGQGSAGAAAPIVVVRPLPGLGPCDAAGEPADDAGAGGDTMQVLAAVVGDLLAKQRAIADHIDRCLAAGGLPGGSLARLLALHSLNAARLGRLLVAQQVLDSAKSGGIRPEMVAALDAISDEVGIKL